MNEMNDQQEMMNNVQGWNTMPSHDIMIPVPIKIQPPLGILDQNNIQMNNLQMNNLQMNNLQMNNMQMNNMQMNNMQMNNMQMNNMQMNNIQMNNINNSSPHPGVMHTSPQTPHVSNF